MVEGARLESVYTGNCIKGSNPLVSAASNTMSSKNVIVGISSCSAAYDDQQPELLKSVSWIEIKGRQQV